MGEVLPGILYQCDSKRTVPPMSCFLETKSCRIRFAEYGDNIRFPLPGECSSKEDIDEAMHDSPGSVGFVGEWIFSPDRMMQPGSSFEGQLESGTFEDEVSHTFDTGDAFGLDATCTNLGKDARSLHVRQLL